MKKRAYDRMMKKRAEEMRAQRAKDLARKQKLEFSRLKTQIKKAELYSERVNEYTDDQLQMMLDIAKEQTNNPVHAVVSELFNYDITSDNIKKYNPSVMSDRQTQNWWTALKRDHAEFIADYGLTIEDIKYNSKKFKKLYAKLKKDFEESDEEGSFSDFIGAFVFGS